MHQREVAILNCHVPNQHKTKYFLVYAFKLDNFINFML